MKTFILTFALLTIWTQTGFCDPSKASQLWHKHVLGEKEEKPAEPPLPANLQTTTPKDIGDVGNKNANSLVFTLKGDNRSVAMNYDSTINGWVLVPEDARGDFNDEVSLSPQLRQTWLAFRGLSSDKDFFNDLVDVFNATIATVDKNGEHYYQTGSRIFKVNLNVQGIEDRLDNQLVVSVFKANESEDDTDKSTTETTTDTNDVATAQPSEEKQPTKEQFDLVFPTIEVTSVDTSSSANLKESIRDAIRNAIKKDYCKDHYADQQLPAVCNTIR